MGLFPISSGGGQFTFVPLTLWYKFATRGFVGFAIQICNYGGGGIEVGFEGWVRGV
jgi:hypothetical protein